MLLNTFMTRFLNTNTGYYTYNRSTGKPYALYEAPTASVFQAHLYSGNTISIPAVSEDGYSRWLAFDSDANNGYLPAIEAYLLTNGWHALREAVRPGREGHLWLFLDVPLPAKALRRWAQNVLAATNTPAKEIEVFPKQDMPDRLATALRLPLGVNWKPEAAQAVGWFEGCPEKQIDAQLEWFAQQPLNSASTLAVEAETLLQADAKRASQRFQLVGLLPKRQTEKLNLLEVIPADRLRRVGNNWQTRCPACALIGQDTHEDNLLIDTKDGTLFCCVEGGMGYGHKALEIVQALRMQGAA